jgi:hypothetical protein
MGTTSSSASANRSPVKLVTKAAPSFLLSGDDVTLDPKSTPASFEATFGFCHPDTVDAVLRGLPVPTRELFGDDGAASVAECVQSSGAQPFALRIMQRAAELVVVGGIDASATCCLTPSFRLTVLTDRDALLEPVLGSKGPVEHKRFRQGPLLFRCCRCALWSSDGVRYMRQPVLVRSLRTELGAVLLHRTASSNCRACRAEKAAVPARHEGDWFQAPPTPAVSHDQSPASSLDSSSAYGATGTDASASTPAASTPTNRGTPQSASVAIRVEDAALRARFKPVLKASAADVGEIATIKLDGNGAPFTHLIIDAIGKGVSGLEQVKTLRRLRVPCKILVVANSDAFGSAAMGSGADLFLSKAASDVQLRVCLYQFLTMT